MNMAEIRNKNAAIGHCWFSPSSMSFFRTKVFPKVYRNRFFVTSEIDPDHQKRYSVRMSTDKGEIETIYEFHSFVCREAAIKAIYDLPDQFYVAFTTIKEEWLKNGDISRYLIGDTDKSSFCGAVQFIVDNYKLLDMCWVETLVKESVK